MAFETSAEGKIQLKMIKCMANGFIVNILLSCKKSVWKAILY